jgi:hypothetical protein
MLLQRINRLPASLALAGSGKSFSNYLLIIHPVFLNIIPGIMITVLLRMVLTTRSFRPLRAQRGLVSLAIVHLKL